MSEEVEGLIDRVFYPIVEKYELDVEYAKRNKEAFTGEEVSGFLKLSLMRTVEELTAVLIGVGVPKVQVAEIVKSFANEGRILPKRVGLPEVKLESFVMSFAVGKPDDSKREEGR